MKLELSTNILPIVIPDTYGTEFCYEIDDNMWDDFKQLMVDKAEEAIKYALDDIGVPYKSLTMGKFHSPREYNFYTDWIDFDIEICDEYITNIKTAVNENFFKFAKERFGSYDGFASFYPYDKREFYDSSKAEHIFSMWVMYRMSQENDIEDYQKAYLDDVWEYASSNGYTIDEEE